MKAVLCLILVAAGGFAALPVEARILECNHCSSLTQMQAEALRAGVGNHIVYSYSHGTISAWAVNADRAEEHDGAGEPTIEAEQATVPSDFIAVFEALTPIYDLTDGTMRAAVTTTPLEIGVADRYSDATAYEFLRDYSMRRRIGGAIVENVLQIGGARIFPEAAVRYWSVFDGPELLVAVVFPDGSEVSYEVTMAGGGEFSAEYKKNSAVGASGMPVPEVGAKG